MGGINHQPCSGYLPESTRLSRAMSLARASFEMANVGLEDQILAELGGHTHSLDSCERQLITSHGFISSMLVSIGELRAKMNELHYVDLPSNEQIDWAAFLAELQVKGMVEAGAFSRISHLNQNGGFRQILDILEEGTSMLKTRTETLQRQVSSLRAIAADGKVNVVLEENQPGNIREAFAQLYTEWGLLQSLFLASALLNTEQWYVFMGFGSLAGARPFLLPADPAVTHRQLQHA